MSSRKSLKQDRVKSYFVDAAKEIVINEGVEGISVRKVSENAGYSYASMYNYYQDLHALLWDVKLAMARDVNAMLCEVNASCTGSKDAIRLMLQAYTNYFVAAPHVFRFLYQYPLSAEQAYTRQIFSFITDTVMQAVQFRNANIDKGKIQTCFWALNGMLMMFTSTGNVSGADLDHDLKLLLSYMHV